MGYLLNFVILSNQTDPMWKRIWEGAQPTGNALGVPGWAGPRSREQRVVGRRRRRRVPWGGRRPTPHRRRGRGNGPPSRTSFCAPGTNPNLNETQGLGCTREKGDPKSPTPLTCSSLDPRGARLFLSPPPEERGKICGNCAENAGKCGNYAVSLFGKKN